MAASTPFDPSADSGTAAAPAPMVGGSREGADPAMLEPKRVTGWIWTIVCVVLAGAGWSYWPVLSPHLARLGLGPAAASKPMPPRITPVRTAVVEQRDMPLYLNALGTVTALKTVTIRSRVEGELTDTAFSEGKMVEEGDLLATIDPRPYLVQKQQAEGQYARDAATLRAAKLTLARLQQLLEMKIATAQQVDDQLAVVQQYEGALQADAAQIAQAELQLTYCRILAPLCGKIGLRQVDEGNMVRPTDPQGLAVITQLQPIALIFTIPQDEITRVQQWMQSEGTLTVEAYDRELRHCLAEGKLLAIDNQVDPTNGTVRLKAEFENADGRLFPNQFVNVRLQVVQLKAALVVPSAAVQRGPNGSFVYVVRPDETAEMRPVKISATQGSESAVSEGLAAGELVVTSGLDRLQPDAKVSTKSSAAESGLPGGVDNASAKRR